MKINILFLCIVLLFGCDKSVPPPPEVQKQLFTESADIDVGKKIVEAYQNADWETYPKFYADDARVWRNKDWTSEEGMTLSEYLEDLKMGLSSVGEYQFTSSTWVGVVTDEGEHWVFFWGVWEGVNTITAKNYVIPVQISMHIVNGKINRQVDFYNNAEIALDLKEVSDRD